MDIKKLKAIIDSCAPNDVKEKLIIAEIAKDKRIIPLLLSMLESERNVNKNIIQDMNLELSRAHIFIDEYAKEPKSVQKGSFNKKFVLSEIEKFYTKYKATITHCFNRFNKN